MKSARSNGIAGAALMLAACIDIAAVDRAAAQTDNMPAAVQSALADRRSYCAAENKPLALGPSAIRALDLSGDGKRDYIVDDSAISCGDDYAWCGSGGCGVAVFMQRADGYAKVVDDIGGKIDLQRAAGGYIVVVPQRGGGLRLGFADGCAIDLKHRRRLCAPAD